METSIFMSSTSVSSIQISTIKNDTDILFAFLEKETTFSIKLPGDPKQLIICRVYELLYRDVSGFWTCGVQIKKGSMMLSCLS